MSDAGSPYRDPFFSTTPSRNISSPLSTSGSLGSSVVSWADPSEVCQMLDYFTSPISQAMKTGTPDEKSAFSTPLGESAEESAALQSWSFACDRANKSETLVVSDR